ncbi:hypothetical protein ACHAWF_010753, partial [Thalassiosira exigua]
EILLRGCRDGDGAATPPPRPREPPPPPLRTFEMKMGVVDGAEVEPPAPAADPRSPPPSVATGSSRRRRRRRPRPTAFGGGAMPMPTRTTDPVPTTTTSPPRSSARRAVVLAALFGAQLPRSSDGYHRSPCTKLSLRRQFQFSDCYVPPLNPDLALGKASFVMAHDAATGYLNVDGDGGDGTDSGYDATSDLYSSEYDGVDNVNGDGGDGGDDDGGDDGYNNNGYQYTTKWNSVTVRLLSLYGKTQVGTVYDQLNDGARALDLRPKIYNNGTVGFHHGSLIDVPLKSVTLGSLLEDAKQWCNDNPKELVLIFHSELVHEAGYNGLSSQVYLETDDDYYGADDADVDDGGGGGGGNDDVNDADDAAANGYDDAYQAADDGAQQQQEQYEYYYSGVAKMKEVYQEHGVPYYPCERMTSLTVEEAMEMADLSKYGAKGYLLATDQHDMYASFCGKANWAEDQLVTCHSKYQKEEGGSNDQKENNQNNNNGGGYVHCTDTKGSGASKLQDLQAYVQESANGEASDDWGALGPPADESLYPFNEIQGFWQVDGTSVQIGITHASNLLDDNRRSQVNEEMVKMAYDGEFDAISIFAMDNVALNGNAMLSVLRTACGQAKVQDDDDVLACGRELAMPNMQVSHRLPLVWNIVLFVVYSALVLMVSVMLFQAFRLRNEGPQEHRLICHGHVV